MEVIGLDIGHSTVKVAAGGQHLIFPTAAAPAVDLHLEEDRMQATGDVARVNGRDYFVGKSALIHTNGNLLDGLADNWIESDEHQALMSAGFRRATKALGTTDVQLVMGLPSRLHGRQKDRLIELAVMQLGLPREQVRVIPQPLGAFMSAILDEKGEVKASEAGRVNGRWGVIDIGYYTADYGLVDSGVWSAAGARSHGGANLIAADLRARIDAEKGITLSLREADSALEARSTKYMGEVIDLESLVEECAERYARTVIDYANQVFGERISTLDGILIAGGAANLLFPHIRKTWKHATTADAARFTIAEGMRRYGLFRLANEEAAQSAKRESKKAPAAAR